MAEVRDAICRVCTNCCALKVEVEDGIVRSVKGNPANPAYRGFTCIKGRLQTKYLRHPDRLLHSLKRMPDGSFARISPEQAMDEVAAKLTGIVEAHGPHAVATYMSGALASQMGPASWALYSLAGKIGTKFAMDPNTLDKGGKKIAQVLHGRWMARAQGFDRPEVALLIGSNPMVACTGFPAGNPGLWYKDRVKAGMKPIIIDPRRTELTDRAFIHMQARPGHDSEILAAIIHVIIAEELYDAAFLAENVDGLEALRAAVKPFTPERAAAIAGIEADDIVLTARTFAGAKRGFVMAGTGPSMSAMGSLVEYLVLCLETLCGHWLREGEVVAAAPALSPTPRYKAQAEPPKPWAVEPMRVRGLSISAAGVPLSTIADEILMPGPGQLRALISGGNPASSFPNQPKVARALRELDLLVQFDVWMSHTAELADYIIVPPMPLEMPDATFILEFTTQLGVGYGYGNSYAQYSPAVATPPPGAELIEQWRFLVGVGERMGFAFSQPDAEGVEHGVTAETSSDQVLELLAAKGRIPFAQVKANPGGTVFPDPPVHVLPRDEGWEGRLDIGNAEMMADLAAIDREGARRHADDDAFPLRLLCRRERHVYNTACNFEATNRGRHYNPAFMHPEDLAELGLVEGDEIRIESALDSVPAIVAAETNLRRGMVSMAWGFGRGKDRDGDFRRIGSSPNRLIPDDVIFDRYTGQPRMSNVPVRVVRIAANEGAQVAVAAVE